MADSHADPVDLKISLAADRVLRAVSLQRQARAALAASILLAVATIVKPELDPGLKQLSAILNIGAVNAFLREIAKDNDKPSDSQLTNEQVAAKMMALLPTDETLSRLATGQDDLLRILAAQRQWQRQMERLWKADADAAALLLAGFGEMTGDLATIRDRLAETTTRDEIAALTRLIEEKVLPPASTAAEIPFLAPSLPPQGVFGRADDLDEIIDLLELEIYEAKDVSPIVLRGMGGVGKTTLSLALAHHETVRRQFPDGVLWTALGPKPVIRWHLESLGRALKLDLLPEHDEASCQARLRSALYSRRVLLIVDDVWDANHGRFFLVGGPLCRTLFTTRELPIAHDLATPRRSRHIEILKPEPALSLLNSLAPQAVAADRKLAAQLCERLEYLPLGLTLAGRLLANEADVPRRMYRLTSELIERREARLNLMQTEGRSGLDEENPVSLHAILGLSVDRLNAVDKERFALIGVFGGDPLTWDIKSAAYMWQSPLEDAERTVSQLIHRGLVERRGDRYWMHALLADYACELIDSMEL